MKRTVISILTVLAILTGCTSQGADNPVNIILETDMGNDVDDALALGLAYKYIEDGKINLLAVCINKEGSAPGEYVDIMNTFYGHPEIPVGIIRKGAYCEDDALNYAKAVVDMRNEDGTLPFRRSVSDYSSLPEATQLYRKILSGQADKSVVIVSIGFSTNLINLMASGPDEYSPLTGMQLISAKVKELVTMAGNFEDSNFHEYNVWKDIPAAQKLFAEWPTPVTTSPFEVGIKTCYPASSIENDFNWAPLNPIVEAYKAYKEMPYDRPMWDPTALMFAVEPGNWFNLSEWGRIEVTDQGGTIFKADPEGDRRYMKIDDTQAKAIIEHFVELIPFKPTGR